ncbi:ribosomal RNA-processing protein 14 [Cladorrhinum samala]|uniref:Ribosomal RNA-processing protein 14 n=1 Tax=Cladorrhinum samala TaxID=585594 RepID=A0AAV9HV41_9PEZI|nr:ribosomal RNA-processing protein 14 [Cladorrhinum samala]
MADDSLKDRLRDYSNSFTGLLSLIPAKMYYGEDTSDQWKKKKQTKEEARAAKRGKLDPDSELHKNAKEILDERARNKRKAQELDDASEGSEDDIDVSEFVNIEKEKPLEGLKKKVQKEESEEEEEEAAEKKEEEISPAEQTPKKLTPKEQKEARKSAKKQKKEEAKRLKIEAAAAATPSKKAAAPAEKREQEEEEKPKVQPSTEVDSDRDENDELAPIDISGLVARDDEPSAPSADSENSPRDSPVFDTAPTSGKPDLGEPASAATSMSSAVPPSEKPKYLKIPVDADTQSRLRARLEVKLGQFRQSRKAVDDDGKPIKTRQELIEARRLAELKRKEHKKELRKLAKLEEDKKREETLASARNSPALSSFLASDDNDKASNHFSFGRLSFTDGTTLSHDASYEKAPSSAKKKGPSDPKTALLKLESQKKRLAALDEEKRKDILEKETWLAARKRAEGEKVVDSESLLKKALKRKEKAKKKSEKEWKDRAEGVTKAIHDRQKKREANLQKRKDDKMAHRQGKKKNKGVQTKSKSRPGFEGGFGRK